MLELWYVNAFNVTENGEEDSAMAVRTSEDKAKEVALSFIPRYSHVSILCPDGRMIRYTVTIEEKS